MSTGATPFRSLNAVVRTWNSLPAAEAAARILPCCGSQAWATAMAAERPFDSMQALLAASNRIWNSLPPADWQQAFDSHPRIGERHPQGASTAMSQTWSGAEQRAAMTAEQAHKDALREANSVYERRFGRIFITCARGRSAQQILDELHSRLANTPGEELREAANQQAQITEQRLKQWMEVS